MATPAIELRGQRGLRPPLEAAISANGAQLVADRLRHYIGSAGDYDGVSWPDTFRIMPASSVYQRWSTARTPYLYDIAHAVSSSDPAHKVVIISKAAQMGLSELILNDLLRRIHLEPAPMLHFMEKEDKSIEWQADRLGPSLRQPPFDKNRSIRLVGQRVEFPGGFLSCRTAGSPNALRSTSARVIYGDECAAYATSIGGEGDWLSLAKQRAVTFGDAGKIVMVSTPVDRTRGEGTFYSAMHLGDYRIYETPCPHCGEWDRWRFEKLLKYEQQGEILFGIQCSHCEGVIGDGDERDEAVRRGRWTATKEARRGHVSFALSGLHAPSNWRPLADIYSEHEMAASGAIAMKSFYNATLGEFYDEPEARMPLMSEVAQRMIIPKYDQGTIPDAACLLTMGVDVQGDHLQWEIKAWSPKFENWSITRGVIQHEIGNTAAVVKAIREIMATDWPRHDERYMRVWACGIDEGYKPAKVHQVQAHFPQPIIDGKVMKMPRGAVVATKGGSVARADSIILRTPGGKTAKGARRRLKFFRIGTDICKREIYMALKAPADSDDAVFGRPHAPVQYDDDYYQELVAEQIITKRDVNTNEVRQVFHLPDRVANEALDIHVINRAMIEILGAHEWTEARWQHVKDIESHHSEVKEKPKPAADRRAEIKAQREAQRQRLKAQRDRRR